MLRSALATLALASPAGAQSCGSIELAMGLGSVLAAEEVRGLTFDAGRRHGLHRRARRARRPRVPQLPSTRPRSALPTASRR